MYCFQKQWIIIKFQNKNKKKAFWLRKKGKVPWTGHRLSLGKGWGTALWKWYSWNTATQRFYMFIHHKHNTLNCYLKWEGVFSMWACSENFLSSNVFWLHNGIINNIHNPFYFNLFNIFITQWLHVQEG